MKTIRVTDFRNKASKYISEVEHGEKLLILRRGKPVAEIRPCTRISTTEPAWKRPFGRLQVKGDSFSSVILSEREEGV